MTGEYDMFWSKWKHITKLDPDKSISREDIEAIVNSGTDAIMVSGTQGVTPDNINTLIDMLEKYDIPRVLEPSGPQHTQYDRVDHVFVPTVFNSKHLGFVLGIHKEWIKQYSIQWDMVTPEAYIVLNPDSKVAQVTGAETNLSMEDAVAYAACAEKYFKLPIIYIEYSGTYGDPELVAGVAESLDTATLFYGGGINNRERAEEMLQYADAIIVGNVIYKEGIDSFLQTIPGR